MKVNEVLVSYNEIFSNLFLNILLTITMLKANDE
jgi:hypothetical protein